MLTIHAVNINEAFPIAMMMLRDRGVPRNSRNGPVLEIDEPVSTMYLRPDQRVLFNIERAANPFFHLFEALWILAGRNDVTFVDRFNRRMRDYSDDGATFHGAYGHRLRVAFGFDQLSEAVRMLRKDPESRRVVLQIWSAKADLGTDSKDIPCNDMVMLKVRDGMLHMTVCNRSNDAIWGAYGTNVVQFSMLQEYLAARIGVDVGFYHQVSDSLHVYTDNPQWAVMRDAYNRGVTNPYEGPVAVHPHPLVTVADDFDNEVEVLLRAIDRDDPYIDELVFKNTFFNKVAIPMWCAWRMYRHHRKGLAMIPPDTRIDWLVAARLWLIGKGVTK